jgi:DNA-binding beta-propeller fold protein YncE
MPGGSLRTARRPAACLVLSITMVLAGCSSSRGRPPIAGTETCTNVFAAAQRLDPPQPIEKVADLPSQPYAVAVSPRWAFVSLPQSGPGGAGLISVLALRGSTARLIRTVPVTGQPIGVTLAGDNRFLLVANALGGLKVLRTSALETGKGRAVIAQLKSSGQGSVEVAVSASERFAFVTEEDSDDVAVYSLGHLLSGTGRPGQAGPHEIGSVPVGGAPSGITLAPGGSLLYVTSQSTPGNLYGKYGELSAISVAEAEHHPSRAVIGSVGAGCDPVRVELSDGGRIAWVTDRGADSVLAFRLSPPGSSTIGHLAAKVRVGPEPVSIAFTDSGAVALVTDSARFSDPNGNQTIAVIGTALALARRPALLGFLPAGAFPRQFGQAPNGPLLFTDFDSMDVRVISTADLHWLQTLRPAPAH